MFHPGSLSAYIKLLLYSVVCLCAWAVVGSFGEMQTYAGGTALLEKGERLVRQHCTRCHVVGDLNKYGGIGSTPSFGAIKSLPDWQDRFAAFWSLLPHPSVVQIEGLSPQRPKGLLATKNKFFWI